MRLTRRFEEDGVKAVWCRSINDTFLEGESGYEEAEKLATYEDAEEQGLLIRLPCKVGDTVYILFRDGVIEEYVVSWIKLCKKTTVIYFENDDCYTIWENDYEEYNKWVFKTKAEAEAALAEMEK